MFREMAATPHIMWEARRNNRTIETAMQKDQKADIQLKRKPISRNLSDVKRYEAKKRRLG